MYHIMIFCDLSIYILYLNINYYPIFSNYIYLINYISYVKYNFLNKYISFEKNKIEKY
jgi:hypothetical protein